MNATKRAYLELHLAVFLWGFTAILGELIQLSAVVLVWWRVLLTGISVLFLIRPGKKLRAMPRKNIFQFALAGILTGLHWLMFYGAIKLANASIALICMATCAFFTAIIEPFFLKQKIKWWEIFLGFLIIPGMALVVESVDISLHLGIWVGLLASLLAALFSILNKKWINDASPLSITFIEMSSAWLFLCLALPFFFYAEPEAVLLPTASDFLLLLVLALLCTTLTWVLALRSLKHMSAFASTLTVNMEPVYGILLAILILKEHRELPPGFYWGVILILVVVFSYPLMNRVRRGKTSAM
ncbi:MAG: EamA family transporter [Saprospiraceae bacterium]|nr:MAG: EamA family transporter [Saprospiraceae bacterium]